MRDSRARSTAFAAACDARCATRSSLPARKREQDGLPDADALQQHHQTVDAETHAPSRWHAELQGAEEVLIDVHRLGVAGRSETGLLLQPFPLEDRVVELRVR